MINDGDFIILRRESFMRVVQARKNGRPIVFDRAKFYLDNIFGKPYGTSFEVDKKSNQLLLRSQDFSVEEALPETQSGQDNRNLVGANEDNQSLGKDEINALRKDGLTGDEVMTELIKNSATFNQKTKFSQEKWIKKKKKRHMNVYTVLRPSARLIAEIYYNREPQKICFLRVDSLAQILTQANVQANSKVLLVESCQGLVAGAVLDRLADGGVLTQLFTGPNPMKGRNAFDDFGYSKDLQKSRMKLYPLNLLSELSVFAHCRQRSAAGIKRAANASTPDMESASDKRDAKKLKRNDSVSAEKPAEKLLATELVNDESSLIQTSDENVTFSAKNVVKQEPLNDHANDNSDELNEAQIDKALLQSSDTVSSLTQSSSPSNHESVPRTLIDESHVDKLSSTRTANSNEKSDGRPLPAYLVERNAAKEFLESTKFDTLIIAVKCQPTQLVLRLLNLVKNSRPFVVYHQYKEPLIELFVQLKERGGVVNLRLSETWYRQIQVLPERTHPSVTMSGTSGYLLSGTTVEK